MADALSTLIAEFEALEAAYRADVEVGAVRLLDEWDPTHSLPGEAYAFSGVWQESIDAARVLDDAEIDIDAALHDEVAGVLQGSVLPGAPAFSVRVTSS